MPVLSVTEARFYAWEYLGMASIMCLSIRRLPDGHCYQAA
mgnify:CR=1 FL=1